ncbi:MAG: adenylosuccinate synthetase [Oligoflexia bacterium]|nr:adenylosuccinate synthetase [Oligoflexia bacterium]
MAAGFADVLIGLQYGDEGKGRIVDAIARDYNIVARFNGGANAGHTVVVEGLNLALALIPSGVINQSASLYIGSGCVVDLAALAKEIQMVEAAGLSVRPRLRISPYTSIVQPHHIFLDRAFSSDIGTTGNGIGQAYADRALRMIAGELLNIRCIDLLQNEFSVVEQMLRNLENATKLYPSIERPKRSVIVQTISEAIELVRPLITTDPLYLSDAVEKGASVLFEGAQSYELDVARGIVPYVTASHTCAGYAYTGGDVPPKFHRKTIGVAKTIMSRVGKGPFASELGGTRSEEYCMAENGRRHNRDYEKKSYDAEKLLKSDDDFELGIGLRMVCGEYGTRTGRPRRIGVFDLEQLKKAVRANYIDELYLTRCDLLEHFRRTKRAEIPLRTPGSSDTNGTSIAFENAWELQNAQSLPRELEKLVTMTEQSCGVTVRGIGVGPERSQLIECR